MNTPTHRYEPYFDDPRLRMTFLGRLTVRVVSYVGYLFLIAAIFTLLFADIQWLKALGFFLAIFFADQLFHWREADRHLAELPQSGKVNVARYLSPSAFSFLERAYQRSAIGRRNFFLEMAHQLVGSPNITEGLERLDVRPKEFQEKTEEFLSSESGVASAREERRTQAGILVIAAFERAIENRHRFIEIADLFSALAVVESEPMKRLFLAFSIEPGDLDRALLFREGRGRFARFLRMPAAVGGFVFESYKPQRHRIMNRAWTARPTPMLDKFSTDFTDLARRGEIGLLVGHAREYERLVDTLARPTNPNALLVGGVGIGKEAVIGHLARALVRDKVPSALFDKRLVALHLGALVSGAQPAELQKRLSAIVDEINIAGNVILCIPEIHNLVKTSGSDYLSAADALMPVIMNNVFPIIGTSYPKEFKEFLEPRSDLTGIFEIIQMEEIAPEDAETLLVYEARALEEKTGIVVSFGAIKKSVGLAKKFLHTKFLPNSASELLKDGIAEAARRGEKILGPETIIRVAETKVNVPIHEASAAESETLLNLEDIIHERFVDQEEAVRAVARALREYRSGLSRPGGPIATFLFVGPTGVGKTELSKILAKLQFGSEKLMVRFDMSEYQDKQSFFRLIGSPDGKTSGALTDAVLAKPYSLVLLDEFEKAYPDILDVFLQVFDDGRLTDNLGRVVDFQNTIIVATSNAHSDIIVEALRHGQSMAQIDDYLKKKLVDIFRPELLNRFSRIIVFKNLEPPELIKIAELNLNDLAATLGTQGIELTYDPEVPRKIASLGYDPTFGARPLREVIEEKLRSPLAEKILRKEVVRGGRIRAVLKAGEVVFVSPNAGE